ncbi:MAG TPA: glycosyltransferase [Methylomirabilota bacterium]|nr:glycosyltransferase [Methylomirabilota bacterium]
MTTSAAPDALRVLVVGHTYTVRLNRDKFYELAKRPDLDLVVVTPEMWPDYIQPVYSRSEPGEPLDVRPLPTWKAGNEVLYVYRPALLGLIRRFRPHVLHVEQGASALVYFQCLVAARLVGRRPRALFFTWVNLPYARPWPFSWIERYNLAHTDWAICGNRDAEDVLRGRGYRGPVTVLPQLGVDPEVFRPLEVPELRSRLGLKHFVIGFVGRLVPEKGLRTLVQAAGRLAGEYQLLLVGRGSLRAEIERAAGALGLADRLVLVDPVPHDQVPGYLNCMDALVLPSLTTPAWKEQFGHVLIEAMACGVPVVGSSSAEIPRVIGDAGLIFREGEAGQLAAHLQGLMDEPTRRARLGQAGRQRVLAHFSHRRIADETYEIYRRLRPV